MGKIIVFIKILQQKRTFCFDQIYRQSIYFARYAPSAAVATGLFFLLAPLLPAPLRLLTPWAAATVFVLGAREEPLPRLAVAAGGGSWCWGHPPAAAAARAGAGEASGVEGRLAVRPGRLPVQAPVLVGVVYF